MSYTVNVRDFGAVGDGVSDDTAAFYSAYDSLPTASGGKVFVPAGNYKIDLIVDQKKSLWLIGEGDRTRLNSNNPDGWAITYTEGSNTTHTLSDLTVRPSVTGNSNGVAVGNSSGVDMYNVRFQRNIIGLYLYRTSYGKHYNTWFGANDVGILFSKRGGAVSNPDTTLAFPVDGDKKENLSNKSFFGTGFLKNRIGVVFDFATVQYIQRVVFNSTSFEQCEIAVTSTESLTNPIPPGTLATDHIQFLNGWFESNAKSDAGTGQIGQEQIFDRTLDRGDIHFRAGRVVFDSFQIIRARVDGVASLTLQRCNLFTGGRTSFVKRAESGVLNLVQCRRAVGTAVDNPLSSGTRADVVHPAGRDNPSGWVRPVVHGVKGYHPRVMVASDFTGPALQAGVSFNRIEGEPTFQVQDGPFGECIEVSVLQGSGGYLAADIGRLPVENRMYLVLFTVKFETPSDVFTNLGQIGLSRVSVAEEWETIAGVTVMPPPGPVPVETRVALDFVTGNVRIAGISIVECSNEQEVEALLSTGALPYHLGGA